MPIREVVEAFDEHVKHIPNRLIDLHRDAIIPRMSLVDRGMVKQKYAAVVDAISEADIEQHTSYANQRRKDVVQTIVKSVVKYATLSHTWQRPGEFTYEHMVSSHSVRDGPGWEKLSNFVTVARETYKCDFAWTDTVCLDPKIPSDLQAAARSGFAWVRNAYVCITYLPSARSLSELEHDVWFRRGWPLSELLASVKMKFYGAGWRPLNVECLGAENDKADETFLSVLSKASGISSSDLRSFLPGPNRVREKLSWASRRETREPEDTAYSLISIFVSDMELDPEEHEKAFLRLMLHIIPRSHECDVFAWAGEHAKGHPAIPSSPACYGVERRDHEFHSDPHRYRLCGDRSFSLDYHHLRIRVIIVDVVLRGAWKGRYKVRSRSHKASVNKVEALSKLSTGARMAIGVIDYDWTDDPRKGELHTGMRYFGFLLEWDSKDEEWEKVDTKKVIFLESNETKEYELEELHLRAAIPEQA